MDRLLIGWCPYCGKANPHNDPHTEDRSGDVTLMWCMSCGEAALITRDTSDDEDDETHDVSFTPGED